MAIKNTAISQEEINQNRVQSARDDYIGTPAQQVKAIFDRLPEKLSQKHNQLIDELSAETAAAAIGAIGGTVQAELSRLDKGKANKETVDLKSSIAYVDERIDEAKVYADSVVEKIGTSDMAKFRYDSNDDGIVNGADRAAFAEFAENGVYSVTHSAIDGVHSLTGTLPESGIATIRFKATSDFAEGGSFTINGAAYTAKPTGEEIVIPDKLFVAGDIVTADIDIDNQKQVFKIGGGGLPKEWQDIRTAMAGEDIAKNDAVFMVKEVDSLTEIITDPNFSATTQYEGIVDISPPNAGVYQLSKNKGIMTICDKSEMYVYELNKESGLYIKLPAPDIAPTKPEGAPIVYQNDALAVLEYDLPELRNFAVAIYHIDLVTKQITRGAQHQTSQGWWFHQTQWQSRNMSDNNIFYTAGNANAFSSSGGNILGSFDCRKYKEDIIVYKTVASAGSNFNSLGGWGVSDGEYDYVYWLVGGVENRANRVETIYKRNINDGTQTSIYTAGPQSVDLSWVLNGMGRISQNAFYTIHRCKTASASSYSYYWMLYKLNANKSSITRQQLWTGPSDNITHSTDDLFIARGSQGVVAYSYDEAKGALTQLTQTPNTTLGRAPFGVFEQKGGTYLYAGNKRAPIKTEKKVYRLSNHAQFTSCLNRSNFGLGISASTATVDNPCKVKLFKKLNDSLGGTL